MSAWSYLNQLSALPHRASASAAEATAARMLAAELQKLGYTIDHQHFRSPRKTLYYGPTVVIAIFLFAALWLGTAYPIQALVLMLLAIAPLVGELLGWPLNLDAILPKFRSQNLVAYMHPAGGTESDSETSARNTTEKPRIIITAHYDTQWGGWLFAPFFRPFLQQFFTSCYVALAVLPITLILRTIFPEAAILHTVLWVASAYLVLAAVWLVASSLGGRYINGANDNGSGTALALELARRVATGELGAADYTFVFTGSEETGTRGMIHFMMEFRKYEREHTYFVNLDNLGAGIPRYLEGEGMLGFTPYHKGLISLAKQISESKSGRVIAKHNLLLPTDGVIAAKAGYPAITFIAMDEEGRIPEYHWHTDTLANVDRGLIEYLEDFLTAYVAAIPTLVNIPQRR